MNDLNKYEKTLPIYRPVQKSGSAGPFPAFEFLIIVKKKIKKKIDF